MSSYNIAIMDASERHLGIAEWPGSQHNPEILRMFADSGHDWVRDDETAWCAAYINSLLGEIGLTGTGKLNARSFLKWGQEVPAIDARPGDVVVLWRGDPNGWQGHVAVLVRFDGGGRMILRGGNQGNAVSDRSYSMSRLLGFRRADGGASPSGRPVLREGVRGGFVRDLQAALRELRYHLGAVDGVFGPRTKDAVMAFQAANGLATDGIVGRRTWSAIESNPAPAPLRKKSVDDLRAAGSDTIVRQDKAQRASTVLGGVSLAGATGTLATQITAAQDGVREISGGMEMEGSLSQIMPWALTILLFSGVGVSAYAWWQARETKAARVRDAQTGAHLGR